MMLMSAMQLKGLENVREWRCKKSFIFLSFDTLGAPPTGWLCMQNPKPYS
jgi:hypothetical protein